jgi:ABC-2 type transport system ATP-binding protein
MIKMLTTLLPPTSGSATVAGYDIVRQAGQVRRLIGYVPQMLSADHSLTGYENLLIGAKLCRVPRREQARRSREALEVLGLTEAANRLVRHYSGGMIRRLEIGLAVLHRPPVLFLDEPTVGLDPLARQAVWEHIRALRSTYGTTILMTTHFMDEADVLCSRVAIMDRGQVAALDTPSALKATVGVDAASLDDVFAHVVGHSIDSGGSLREITRTRRKSRRLG